MPGGRVGQGIDWRGVAWRGQGSIRYWLLPETLQKIFKFLVVSRGATFYLNIIDPPPAHFPSPPSSPPSTADRVCCFNVPNIHSFSLFPLIHCSSSFLGHLQTQRRNLPPAALSYIRVTPPQFLAIADAPTKLARSRTHISQRRPHLFSFDDFLVLDAPARMRTPHPYRPTPAAPPLPQPRIRSPQGNYARAQTALSRLCVGTYSISVSA